MKKSVVVRLVLVVLVSLVALVMVSYKIFRAEYVLSHGTAYLFPLRGYDPSDVLRGRYLNFQMSNTAPAGFIGVKPKNIETIYGNIVVDERGLARIDSLSAEKPKSGEWIELKRLYGTADYFMPPFSRFYINEDIAYEAEHILREATSPVLVISSVRERRPAGFFPNIMLEISREVLVSAWDSWAWNRMLSEITAKRAVVKIRVLNGFPVLEDLLVDGRPIADLARERLSGAK